MTRRNKPRFDILGDLIARMEVATGLHDGAEPQLLIDRIDAAAADLKSGVLKLHKSKQSAATEILLDELERVARRAVRLAGEHGASIGTEVNHGQPG